MTDLESALRAALGVPEPEPETFQQDDPAAPLALNNNAGLRAILMGELQNHADNTARQKQSEAALHQMIQTIQK
jgi:hypothetical protein